MFLLGVIAVVMFITALPSIIFSRLSFFTGSVFNFGNLYATTTITHNGVQAPPHAIYGVLPLIVGTLSTSIIALALAVPISVGGVLMLSEIISRRIANSMAVFLELLAGIPNRCSVTPRLGTCTGRDDCRPAEHRSRAMRMATPARSPHGSPRRSTAGSATQQGPGSTRSRSSACSCSPSASSRTSRAGSSSARSPAECSRGVVVSRPRQSHIHAGIFWTLCGTALLLIVAPGLDIILSILAHALPVLKPTLPTESTSGTQLGLRTRFSARWRSAAVSSSWPEASAFSRASPSRSSRLRVSRRSRVSSPKSLRAFRRSSSATSAISSS